MGVLNPQAVHSDSLLISAALHKSVNNTRELVLMSHHLEEGKHHNQLESFLNSADRMTDNFSQIICHGFWLKLLSAVYLEGFLLSVLLRTFCLCSPTSCVSPLFCFPSLSVYLSQCALLSLSVCLITFVSPSVCVCCKNSHTFFSVVCVWCTLSFHSALSDSWMKVMCLTLYLNFLT